MNIHKPHLPENVVFSFNNNFSFYFIQNKIKSLHRMQLRHSKDKCISQRHVLFFLLLETWSQTLESYLQEAIKRNVCVSIELFWFCFIFSHHVYIGDKGIFMFYFTKLQSLLFKVFFPVRLKFSQNINSA